VSHERVRPIATSYVIALGPDIARVPTKATSNFEDPIPFVYVAQGGVYPVNEWNMMALISGRSVLDVVHNSCVVGLQGDIICILGVGGAVDHKNLAFTTQN